MPRAFCLWSYIIFSTVWRVSPSRSESFEFSGSTFCVLISGSPFTTQPNGDLVDSSGRKTYLMGAVREIFQELHTEPQWKGAKVGIASSCDEPSWARECLKKFTVGSGTPLQAIVDDNLIEIYKARSKQEHLTQISKKSGVPFEQIMFLDNERGNCNAVSKLGVT